MANPWKVIDKLWSQHKADKARAELAMSEAKATRLKVLDTGIWKCRFRPFRSGPVDVRGRGAEELTSELKRLTQERATAKETARKEERRAQREEDAKVKAELRALGAKKIKVKRVGEPPRAGRWWSCTVKLKGEVREFEARPCEVLLVDVRHVVGGPQ